jgi:hypothetical protein
MILNKSKFNVNKKKQRTTDKLKVNKPCPYISEKQLSIAEKINLNLSPQIE